MKYSAITGPIFEQHDREGHVESQDRLLGIIDRLPEQVTRRDPVPAAPGRYRARPPPGIPEMAPQAVRKECGVRFHP